MKNNPTMKHHTIPSTMLRVPLLGLLSILMLTPARAGEVGTVEINYSEASEC